MDIILTNSDWVVDAFATSPIKTSLHVQSDHKVVSIRTKTPRVEQYQVRSFTCTRVTDEGILAFGKWLTKQTWNEVYSATTADAKVSALHAAFNRGVSECFEKRFQKRKTTEPPWMTDAIRDMIRKRREVYKADEGRSLQWLSFKKRIAKIVKERKKTFYKQLRDKFTGAESSRNFYKNVNGILRGYEQEHWDVRTMRPGSTDQEIAEELSVFFNKISESLDPHSVISEDGVSLPVLTVDQVEDQIRKSRRPTSTVPGDLPPIVYKHYSQALSMPITDVYNTVLQQNMWPAEWRKEYITVIPKTPSPDSFDQLRNIACTNYLSKILERFVLDWSRKEVQPKTNQFGGEKGCGPAHLLIEATDYITESLEENRAAVVATSMDYSKAFNRLNHESCIQAFKLKGASPKILRILSSFLTGRTMCVRLRDVHSEPKKITTGAPQGSVLGAYLFNVGIDTIEDGCVYPTEGNETIEHLVHKEDCPAMSTPRRVTMARRSPGLSPIREDGPNVDILPRSANIPPWIRKPKERRWVNKAPKKAKFIDDGIHLVKVNMRIERLLYKDGRRCSTTSWRRRRREGCW